MTLPDERYRSIQQARLLLEELCDPRATPRIAAAVRDRARGCLRHYPSHWDMQRTALQAPDVFQEQMDDLHKMILRYEQETVARDPEL